MSDSYSIEVLSLRLVGVGVVREADRRRVSIDLDRAVVVRVVDTVLCSARDRVAGERVADVHETIDRVEFGSLLEQRRDRSLCWNENSVNRGTEEERSTYARWDWSWFCCRSRIDRFNSLETSVTTGGCFFLSSYLICCWDWWISARSSRICLTYLSMIVWVSNGEQQRMKEHPSGHVADLSASLSERCLNSISTSSFLDRRNLSKVNNPFEWSESVAESSEDTLNTGKEPF